MNRKNNIIIAMCIAVFVMVIGYAAFSTNLIISGTANIESNWKVLFTKIEKVEANTTSGATEIDVPQAIGTTATFNVDLQSPGDKIVYKITLANQGSLDAVISEIKAQETGSDALSFTVTGIKVGDKLASSTTKELIIEIKYLESVTTQPEVLKNKLMIEINCVQDLNQTITEEDIEIVGPVLTTLSGNNTLSLENSAGRALANYTITGNSVQNGTPTPDTPVEIESVGVKTKNLYNPVLDTRFTLQEDGSYLSNQIIGTNSIPIEEELTGKYNISIKVKCPVGTNYRIRVRYKDGTTQDSYIASTGEYVDISLATNGEDIASIGWNYSIASDQVQFKEFQIERGDTKTEYEPYGYKIPVKTRGKNHINIEHLGNISNWDTVPTYASYEITLPNGTYTFNIETEMENYKNNILILSKIKSSSKSPLASIISGYNNVERKQGSFTVSDNEKIYLNWYTINKDQTNLTNLINDILNNFIIEDGDTFTGYEPYIEPVTTNVYLNEPLRCINGTCDYIDFSTKQIVRNIRSLNLRISNMNNNEEYPGWTKLGQLKEDYPDMNQYLLYFTKFMSNIIANNENGFAINTVGSNSTMFLNADNFGLTQTEWKTNYPNLEVNVLYRLATPDIKSINLPTIYTLEGDSTISITNDNGVSIPIQVSYYKMS